MNDYRHLTKALLTLIVFSLVYLGFRWFMTPESYSMYGKYRGANVQEQMSKKLVHRGYEFCVNCHEKSEDDVLDGKHEDLGCESCHVEDQPHAEASTPRDQKLASMPKVSSQKDCMMCHAKLKSRPKEIKTVQVARHYKRVAEDKPIPLSTDCVPCHHPHTTETEEDEEDKADEKDEKN